MMPIIGSLISQRPSNFGLYWLYVIKSGLSYHRKVLWYKKSVAVLALISPTKVLDISENHHFRWMISAQSKAGHCPSCIWLETREWIDCNEHKHVRGSRLLSHISDRQVGNFWCIWCDACFDIRLARSDINPVRVTPSNENIIANARRLLQLSQ